MQRVQPSKPFRHKAPSRRGLSFRKPTAPVPSQLYSPTSARSMWRLGTYDYGPSLLPVSPNGGTTEAGSLTSIAISESSRSVQGKPQRTGTSPSRTLQSQLLTDEAAGENTAGSSACIARLPAPRVSWEQLERLHHLGSGEFCSVWAAQLTPDSQLGSVPVALKARATPLPHSPHLPHPLQPQPLLNPCLTLA